MSVTALERVVEVAHADELLVNELLDAESGQFASIARPFHAAEWKLRRGPGRVIDEHHARELLIFIKTSKLRLT